MKNLMVLALMLSIGSLSYGIQLSNYPFDVEKSGSGSQSIIFIPGFACSGEVWKETIESYQNSFTCYTLTMAGFASAQPHPDSNFQRWSNGIADFIKDNHIERTIVIGHSMGGALAMSIAADFPDLIEKIVIVDALPCLAALMNPNFEHQTNFDCTSFIEQIMALTEEQFYQMQKSILSQMLHHSEMIDDIMNWIIQSDRMTLAQMYCEFTHVALREKVTNIKCPTLVMLESNFKNFASAIEDQFQNLKSANDKGLHFIMYDDKIWYFEQLANYLLK